MLCAQSPPIFIYILLFILCYFLVDWISNLNVMCFILTVSIVCFLKLDFFLIFLIHEAFKIFFLTFFFFFGFLQFLGPLLQHVEIPRLGV